ncbi:MAG: anti-sigma factor family protein [Burkholderiales bacterium]
MDCSETRKLLDSYLDRELDRENVIAVARHLDGCGECKRMFDLHSSIASAIRKRATYHPAPPSLANRIRAQIAQAAPRPENGRPRSVRWPLWNRWFQMGSAVAAAVLITTIATTQLGSKPGDQMIVEQVMDAHSRATLTSHQIDIASSDQHTVKPWLSSKLDFSPTVTDLTTAGFPLRGGRLDYVDNRPVAVLVYGHRQHVIDLFIWPDDGASDRSRTRSFSKRGLNVLHWSAAGMTHWAVSDVNSADLEAFAERYASAK